MPPQQYTTMKEIEIIAYKQGNQWVVNENGYTKQLHYSVKTKQDVINLYAYSDNPDVKYKVTFA